MGELGFPRVIAGAVVESLEHLLSFGEQIRWRRARLVKRRTARGNEINDDVPLGKLYKVGPKAHYIPLGEEAYMMLDGGWMPAELLEVEGNG